MPPSCLRLYEGAILIADVHYDRERGDSAFVKLLEDIEHGRIATPQLILLGDIFDTLFGSVPYSAKENKEIIERIERIGTKIEVLYLEGNHDFRLQDYFKHVHTFSLAKQPLVLELKGQRICLAHGDYDAPLGYKLYSTLIRNRFVLFLLNLYDSVSRHAILRFVKKHIAKKGRCSAIEGFEAFVARRFRAGCACDIVIEGHFHQNKTIELGSCRYVNLAAFACNQSYFVVQFEDSEIIFKEQKLA